METAEQVYNRVFPEISRAWGKKDAAIMVAKVYANQCCEDLKNRLADSFDNSETADSDIDVINNARIITP